VNNQQERQCQLVLSFIVAEGAAIPGFACKTKMGKIFSVFCAPSVVKFFMRHSNEI
jgi:hypothetical protein